ncbi:hypothetical protein [Mycobacterium sp.]|uniref:hypothetical protein n=1 Tax=Mycobacterium sp. TaxID=1785 RepID=UPI0031DA0D5E
MVVIDPFGAENKLEIVSGMPQTTKRNFFRKVPSFYDIKRRSRAMLQANLGVGKFMASHRGTTGTVARANGTRISVLSMQLGQAMSGKDYGGLSVQQRKEQEYAAADASIRRQEKVLSEKSVQ